MVININSGSINSQSRAIELIDAFKVKFPNQVVSFFIGSNNVKAILDQEGRIGIKVYNDYDTIEQKISLVLVGLNRDGKDMLTHRVISDNLSKYQPICSIHTILSEPNR